MKKFIFVNILFIIGMILLSINHVHHWFIWTLYIILWGAADSHFAKDFHLSSLQWFYIILGLTILDLFILYLIN